MDRQTYIVAISISRVSVLTCNKNHLILMHKSTLGTRRQLRNQIWFFFKFKMAVWACKLFLVSSRLSDFSEFVEAVFHRIAVIWQIRVPQKIIDPNSYSYLTTSYIDIVFLMHFWLRRAASFVSYPTYLLLCYRPHSIIPASCKPVCKLVFRPGFWSGFRQVRACLQFDAI